MEANDRLERRRKQPDRQRHQGTIEQLHIRYRALHQLETTARSQRLASQQNQREVREELQERAQRHPANQQEGRRQPKAPPPGRSTDIYEGNTVFITRSYAEDSEYESKYEKKLIEKHNGYKQLNKVNTEYHLHGGSTTYISSMTRDR
eukprot:4841153-Amphidinium_carterae.5